MPAQPEPILLYRIDANRNMRRFYRLSLDRDLFGYWILVNEWGRIGRPGQTQLRAFASRAAAEALCAKTVQQKRLRGYYNINASWCD